MVSSRPAPKSAHEAFPPGLACGTVYDGLSKGSHDIEHQTSTNAIGAHWTNFGPKVLYYEWAIISHHTTLPTHSDFGKCYKSLNKINPDIQTWTKLGPNERSAVNKELELAEGNMYRVLVRATFQSGDQLVSSSNGVRVISKSKAQDLPKSAFSTFDSESLEGEQGDHHSSTEFISKPQLQKRNEQFDFPECPDTDGENQCRTAQVSVSEKLGETYGKPNWGLGRALLACLDNANVNDEGVVVPRTTFVAVPGGLVVAGNQGLGEDGRRRGNRGGDDDDDDDDDDGNNSYPWIIAPIVGGTLLILCCLLLLLLLALLLTRGVRMPRFSLPERSPKKDNVAFGDFEETEKEKKGYGMREVLGPGNVDSETIVEFPDTQVRRLSISHADGPEAAVSETHSPRRKHPIMSSTSSSFRDYHGVN